MKKTNAARLLDRMKIDYEILEYDVDLNDLGAENVASKVGQDINKVFKTLVAKGDKTGVLVSVIPGNKELNLKNLASISGNKKVGLVPLKDVQKLTGYVRGGVSPIGMKKKYPVYIDQSINNFEKIFFSAGIRGQQFCLLTKDLIKVVDGTVCKLV